MHLFIVLLAVYLALSIAVGLVKLGVILHKLGGGEVKLSDAVIAFSDQVPNAFFLIWALRYL